MSFFIEAVGTPKAVVSALETRHFAEDAELSRHRLESARKILHHAVEAAKLSCSQILGGVSVEIRGHFDSEGNGGMTFRVQKIALYQEPQKAGEP